MWSKALCLTNCLRQWVPNNWNFATDNLRSEHNKSAKDSP